jgi:hypothetical protein
MRKADVANAKNLGVDKVLWCVSAAHKHHDGRGTFRNQPRAYSPQSVAQFNFDFAAYF